MSDHLVKIGDTYDVKPAVFELVIYDHVPFVDPNKYGLKSAEFTDRSIDPAKYFVTSGDAVEKTKILERDIWNLAGDLRKLAYSMLEREHKCSAADAQKKFRNGIRPVKPKMFSEYESDVWKAAGSARKLLNALITARGEDCFLETEWDNHKLLCIPKNPRSQKV